MKRGDLQNQLGMTMVLISGSMLFATLLLGYAIFRTSAEAWPPVGVPAVGLGYPMLSTVAILVSSWFMRETRRLALVQDLRRARFNLDVTLALGVLFMGIQVVFWNELRDSGLFVGSGIFSSVLYGFTWIHAAHVVLGILSLLWLRLVLTVESKNVARKSRNVEMFWHFLGLVWFIMFLTLFVL